MIAAALRKAELIQASLSASPGDHTFEELLQDVASGRCIILEGARAVMVLEQRADSLNGWIVGGDLSEVLSILPGAEALARAMNKPFATFLEGRKAWRRVLARHGYVWNGVEHRKAL